MYAYPKEWSSEYLYTRDSSSNEMCKNDQMCAACQYVQMCAACQPVCTNVCCLPVCTNVCCLPVCTNVCCLPVCADVQSIDRVLSFSPIVGIGTPPPPHLLASVFPLPLVRGGGGGGATLAWGRGGLRGGPIPARGQTLLYSRYLCTLCADDL
jgi:hypothetical protein